MPGTDRASTVNTGIRPVNEIYDVGGHRTSVSNNLGLPPLCSGERTVSGSSASTATPPKLFDSDLALDPSELEDLTRILDRIDVRSRDGSPLDPKLVS